MAHHVRVDLDVCQGHGLCFAVSDQLFDLREPDGKAVVLVDPIPEDLLELAQESIDACPERALALVAD